MANYFEIAASNQAQIAETVNAMYEAASETGVTFSDATQYVELASENPELKEALRSRLAQLAARDGLDFNPEAAVSAAEAAETIAAFKKFQSGSSRQFDRPEDTPITLMFIGAVLIFAPSVFGTTSRTVTGSTV